MLSVLIKTDITILFIPTCICLSLVCPPRLRLADRNSFWQTTALHFGDLHDTNKLLQGSDPNVGVARGRCFKHIEDHLLGKK